MLLGSAARAAGEPLWILLAAPDLRQPLEKLAAQRKADHFRVVTLDSTIIVRAIAGTDRGPASGVLRVKVESP